MLVDFEDVAQMVGGRAQRPVQRRQGFTDDIDNRAVNPGDMAYGPVYGVGGEFIHRSWGIAQAGQ